MGVKRFKRQYPLLSVFSRGNPRLQQAIVKNADPEFIRAIVDIVVNLLRGNIKGLPSSQVKKLDKYKTHFRKIGECSKIRGGVEKARKAILVQKGGFLPLLPLLTSIIPAAATAIGSLISGLGKKQ